MSNAEDLLNNLPSNMPILGTTNPQEEGHIVIGDDRVIRVPDELKRIAVQNDNRIETVTFDCPRYWDNHDLTEMNIFIHYVTRTGGRGVFLAKNVTVDPINPDIIHFTWNVTEEISVIDGDLEILVAAKKTVYSKGEEIRWYSEINKEMRVSRGLDNSDYVYSENPDIINDLITRMDTIIYADTPILDTSLTQAGLAAEAKATGDAINNSNTQLINKINTDINTTKNNLQLQINSLASGSPKSVYATVSALKSANPETGVYIVSANGHIYSWTKNQSGDPTDLGVYQSTGISESDPIIVDINDKINEINKDLDVINWFNAQDSIEGKKTTYSTSYTIDTLQNATNGVCSNKIPVKSQDVVRINHGRVSTSSTNANYGIIYANAQGNIISYTMFEGENYEGTAPNGATQLRFTINKSYNPNYATEIMCTINKAIPSNFVAYGKYYKKNQMIYIANSNQVGGIIADERPSNKGSEVKIDSVTGKAYAIDLDNRKLYLPKTVYHKSGNTLKMPYRSIFWTRDINSVYFKSSSLTNVNTNKVLHDHYQRVELASSTSENLFVLDSKTDEFLENKIFDIKSVNTSTLQNPTTQKNMLIVGDSFIAQEHIPNYFKNKLNEYGLTNINFVGLKQTSEGVKHEGHGGHAFVDYISDPATISSSHVNPFWNASTNRVDFANYASRCGVSVIDYIYIHLGVNDLLDNTSNEDICSNMTTFINYAKASFPNVEIIVDGLVIPSLLCPSNYNPIAQSLKIFKLNEAMETTCLNLSNVYYSPIVATFNAEYAYPYQMVAPFEGSTELVKELTDYLHPYECGYNMIAYQSSMCFLYNCIQENE